MEQALQILKIRENAILPKRTTPGAAGMDVYACIEQPVTVEPQSLVMIPTGIAIALPHSGYGAFLFARSGLGVKHGVCLSNGVGVIDSDYRGEVCVGLCNISGKSYTIQPQERIAQMVLLPVGLLPVQEAFSLDETARGNGGFGSTGKV